MSISLSEAITQLRDELTKAIFNGKNQDITFIPNNIDIELGVTFATEAKVGGGVKLLTFLDISSEGKVHRESQHKIKLSLSIIDRDGKPIEVCTDKLPRGL